MSAHNFITTCNVLSHRTFFRCTLLDTLYKTDNAKCSQLLLKYSIDSFKSIVRVACHVPAYAVMMYAVTLSRFNPCRSCDLERREMENTTQVSLSAVITGYKHTQKVETCARTELQNIAG